MVYDTSKDSEMRDGVNGRERRKANMTASAFISSRVYMGTERVSFPRIHFNSRFFRFIILLRMVRGGPRWSGYF